jgi:hypothetical protein
VRVNLGSSEWDEENDAYPSSHSKPLVLLQPGPPLTHLKDHKRSNGQQSILLPITMLYD